MAQLRLNLETVGELDSGTARIIADHEIAKAVEDVDDRGDDGKPRKVTMELELVKRANGLVEATFTAQAKLPPRKTASTVNRPKKRASGGLELIFEQYSPDNPDQRTFDALDRKDGE